MSTPDRPDRAADPLDPEWIRKRYVEFILEHVTDDITDTVAQELVSWEVVEAIAAEWAEWQAKLDTTASPEDDKALRQEALRRHARWGRACAALVEKP